ncbi:hypothetical protein NEOC65_001121 [Neochlamydia sp. AcF65]|nr:hypothetical protein [Neochlamydia sp. AcF65]
MRALTLKIKPWLKATLGSKALIMGRTAWRPWACWPHQQINKAFQS